MPDQPRAHDQRRHLISNDNWTATCAAALCRQRSRTIELNESAILTSLPPGQFTAILAGKNNGTGIGIIEVYNLR